MSIFFSIMRDDMSVEGPFKFLQGFFLLTAPRTMWDCSVELYMQGRGTATDSGVLHELMNPLFQPLFGES